MIMHALITKENLVRSALEAILIVFSVLLALFLDNAIEERKEAREIDTLVSHIADEMKGNLTIVDEWLPYHRAMVDKVDRYLDSEELRYRLLRDEGIDYGGLMERGLIQDFYSISSWQLAQQSEVAAGIKFDVASKISRAYLSQQNVNLTIQRFSDFFFDRQTHDPDQLVNSLRILRNLLQELSGQQSVLQQHYRVALDAVDRMNAARD
jgi:hypothetical protein